jgi:hypothetical protein
LNEDDMYDTKVHHPLSDALPPLTDDVEQTLWSLFVAIGTSWQLSDANDAEQYRLRLRTFMENRIALQPLYTVYYAAAAALIADLTAQKDANAAYNLIFFGQNPDHLTFDQDLYQIVLDHVSFEFIAFRLAVGSFRTFGARNYPGYFGGANLAGEPVPYRPAEGLK